MEQEGVVSLIENRLLTPDEIGLLASLITDEPDHYTVLGVNRNASSEEIQSAYCLAVEYFHPLKSRNITESDSVMHWRLSSAFRRIEDAFTVLSHRNRRKVYDDELSVEQFLSAQPRQHHRSPASSQPRQSLQPEPASLQIEESGGRTNELRRVERVRLRLPVRVSIGRNWKELTETLDVSPLGIRFRLWRPVEPGSELRIELPMPKQLRTHNYEDDLYVASAFVLYVANHECGCQVVAELI